MQSSIQRSRTTTTTNSQANSRVRAEMTWQFLDFTRQPTINSASASYSAQRYAFYLFSRDLVNQIQLNYFQLLAQKDLSLPTRLLLNRREIRQKYNKQGSKQGVSVSGFGSKLRSVLQHSFTTDSIHPNLLRAIQHTS